MLIKTCDMCLYETKIVGTLLDWETHGNMHSHEQYVFLGRRIEDKLDALEIYSELVMLRMADPPGQKHVPLQFPAWVCLEEGSRESNAFKTCQLISDRHGAGFRRLIFGAD